MLKQKEALAEQQKAEMEELNAKKEAADTELAEFKKEVDKLK